MSKVKDAIKKANKMPRKPKADNSLTTKFIEFNPQSSVFIFEKDKEYIGKITIGKNNFYGKGKDGKNQPMESLYFHGKQCPNHYALMQLANAIQRSEIKSGTLAKITFKGVTGTGEKKYASYDIQVVE